MRAITNPADDRIDASYQLVFVCLIAAAVFLSAIGPVAVLAIAVGVPPAAMLVMGRTHLDRLVIVLLINLLFWLAYAIICGAVTLQELVNPAFYAGKGRIFLTYIPFVTLMALSVRHATLRAIDMIFRIFAAVTLLAVAANATGVLPDVLLRREGVVLLMSSHHSAGYFFAYVALYFIARILPAGLGASHWDMLLAGTGLLGLLSTNSRTALLGVVLALALYYAGRILVPRVIFAACALAVVAVTAGPPVLQATNPRLAAKIAAISDPRTMVAANTAVRFVIEADDPVPFSEELENRQFNNITVRLYLWTIALKKFVQSPILGMGMMRWTDQRHSTTYSEIPGVLRILTDSGEREIGVGNAHNTYLMFLAQTGLVGLALILTFWIGLVMRLRRIAAQAKTYGDFDIQKLAIAGQLMVFFVFGAGFTAHSFAAPSIGFLPLMVAGALLSALRAEGSQKRAENLAAYQSDATNSIKARADLSQV